MNNSIETLVNAPLNSQPLSPLPAGNIASSDVFPAPAAAVGKSIAFVDSGLANIDDLIASLTDATVYVMDPQQDGVRYIGEVLSQLQREAFDIGSIHIFAHGDAGELQLGSTTLTADNLIGYSQDLAAWGQSHTQDVLLYGCNVAEGATGNAFLDQLVALTGADIQASNDVTGSAELGGDWDLEVTKGAIESSIAISAVGQSTYQGSLASSPTIISDGGGASAAITVDAETSYITDVNVIGANGYFEGFGVEYYFSGGLDSYLFNIDVNTGVVSFNGAFDYNNPTDVGRDNVYDINVLAIDWTGQFDTQAISITVQSDEIPEPFGLANDSNISVNEGETAVADLNVVGAAHGFNENFGVEYYFFGGQDSYLFNLNHNTGELSFATAPNYESPVDANRNNIYEVGILAIDYSGQSAVSNLSIAVQDVIEAGSPPVITSNGGTSYALIDMPEGTTLVTDMSVTGSNGQSEGNGITYSIWGGIDARFFNIDANTGVLSFKTAPDFESPADSNGDNLYGVDILVTDANGQIDSQFIHARVTDVVEVTQPIITSNGGGDTAVIELDEGTLAVTDVTTTGSNGYSEGNGLSYTLNAGADADLFNIDPNTGVISFKTAPDFENPADADGNNVYFANVLVQDPTGQSDSQFLSIVVKDVAEGGSAPVITSSGGGNSALVKVPENSSFVVDVQSTDADGDTEGNGITYRINAGEDAGAFNINANTGVISFKVAPDYESPTDQDGNNIYRINVLATDSTGKTDSQFLQVEVTNEVAVYLLGGQSNMAGATSDAAFLAGSPQANPLPAVQIWNPGINSFTALRPGFNGNFGTGSGFGAEVGFGHAMEAARANGSLENNEEIYLVKYAIGATSLAEDWNINGNGNRYDEFTQWVDGALANLANAGIGYSVEGMLWMQGENDAIALDRANNYQNNLDDLIGDVRSRYGAAMDFVIGRLHEELTPFFYTYADTVRSAQVNVANSDPNNYWVDTDDFVVNPIDGVHFDSSGHLALGEAFASVFVL